MKKELNKGLLVLVVILSLLVVGLSSYLIYDKVFKGDNNVNKENDLVDNDINKEEDKVDDENIVNNIFDNSNDDEEIQDNVEVITGKFGQVLNSGIGEFIVDKTGVVYYIPAKSWNSFGTEYKLNFNDKDKKRLGKYGVYQVEIDMYPGNNDKDSIEAYKLDLFNIKSVYEVEVGNGGSAISIIFLGNDGKVSKLSFVGESPEKNSLDFYKNIEGYSNIVSVVQNNSYDGNDAILIDKDGNEFK